MKEQKATPIRFSKITCTVIKVLQSLWCLFFGGFGLGEGIQDVITQAKAGESYLFNLSASGVFAVIIAGVIISWLSPRIGGAVTIIGAISLWLLFILTGNMGLPVYLNLPVFIFGLALFLQCGRRRIPTE